MKLAALVLLLAALPAPALAQAYQCQAPAAPPSVPAITADGPARPVPVARYTLALSWSPEFCRGRENSAANAFQCSGSGGRFGFIRTVPSEDWHWEYRGGGELNIVQVTSDTKLIEGVRCIVVRDEVFVED